MESLGHRRWLLFPFLKDIAYGRVDGTPKTTKRYSLVTAVSLKVIDAQVADISDTDIAYVAYPYHDYPTDYFKHGWYSSFSVVADKEDRWNNDTVDFSHSTITVTDENGLRLPVTATNYQTDNYGLSNILQWKVGDTKNGIKYRVVIDNVLVQNIARNYRYWFKIH